MALAAAEEDVEDSDGFTFGANLDTMQRLEMMSCSLMGCSCKGYRGPRLLIAYSLRIEETSLGWVSRESGKAWSDWENNLAPTDL